jgi:hypothetical protein
METRYVYLEFTPEVRGGHSSRAAQYVHFLHGRHYYPEYEAEISREGITHAWYRPEYKAVLNIGVQSNGPLTKEQLRRIRGNFPGALQATQFELRCGLPEGAEIKNPMSMRESDVRPFPRAVEKIVA